jgi:hypothetical protein
MGVVLEGARFSGTRGGAEMDLGGGGGRLGAAEACGGGGRGCVFSLLAAGFFSQPERDDCSMFASVQASFEVDLSCSDAGLYRQVGNIKPSLWVGMCLLSLVVTWAV